ncbi:MAG: ATP-binding cassette domain-containing protein [Kiritimatiellae bacterium]|nr:ATP-binding cassette domain-containing protein [Kiritimatiellia bacterium]
MTDITITGAKVHNLRNIDVTIPRNSLTVVTGLSGSGKSSLAFDTLYAEGQRRYVESLSAYARQFLDRMQKPDVEKIEGLSPAISIEQRTTSGNPRSIVATVTEIHDYLRILYGSAAVAHCPHCGRPVTKQSAEQIVDVILGNGKRRIIIYAPVVKGKKGRHESVIEELRRKGFVRVRVDGTTYPIEEVPALDKKKAHSIYVVVDRLAIPCDRTRLTDSVELALKTGGGIIEVEEVGAQSEGQPSKSAFTTFSELNACPDCGISFEELKPRSFSFNSPFGACPTCSGIGQLYFFDEELVVPDKTLPLEEAIHPWRRLGGQMAILYHKELLSRIAAQYKVKLSTPYEKLPAKFRHGLMHGFKDDLVLPWRSVDRPFEGVLAALQRKRDEAQDDEVRAKYDAYQSFRVCPDCHGARLRPESCAATVAGKTIIEVMAMPVTEALEFFTRLCDNGCSHDHAIPQSPNSQLPKSPSFAGLHDVLREIVKRLEFLIDVGLDYLTLDRASSSLSGGEMQRIRLATQIGSGLTGVLYVLDEPTIGLHPRDNERLISTLKGLRDRGNTVVVVEHDEEMMRAADYIVDLGPGAGREGGLVMYQGPFPGLLKAKSLTADYLTGRKTVCGEARGGSDGRTAPEQSGSSAARSDGASASKQHGSSAARFDGRTEFGQFLTISGCSEHNLKNITARFPVGAFTVVSGVSGSGKSTLVEETLKRALMQRLYNAKERPGKFRRLSGVEYFDKVIEIDQSPIGRTPRSNPATYVGFFSEIRELFAKTEAARARGYTAGRFSFNVKGGRCEVCGGDGSRKLEMSFLPDVYVTCEQCGGKRFNSETLEVTYGGKSIADVLEMTVAEAADFFAKVPSLSRRLRTLADVGLGYIALGQSATTLSGGEAQRIKLATELSRRSTGKTLYLLDEPTTGLHFDDVAKLMKILLGLRDQGNTVIVIEHNIDVMRCADWIVDLGPGGGDQGGNLVCEGPVSAIRACKESFTGRFL